MEKSLDRIITESLSQVLTERIKTRDAYAEEDKKEGRRLFKSLIGLLGRCDDPSAAKIAGSLAKLMGATEKVNFASYKRRYNYTPVKRRQENDKIFNDGMNAVLNMFEEDGFI